MLEELNKYLYMRADEAISSQVLWYGLAGAFFLTFLLGFLRKLRSEFVSVFSDEDGSVHITSQALRELVKKSCECIAGVHNPSTSIQRRGGKIRLQVKIRVEPDCRVREVRKLIGQKLQVVMVDHLNFKEFEGVDVIIHGFEERKQTGDLA